MNYNEHDNYEQESVIIANVIITCQLCPIKRFMRLIEKVTNAVLISCNLPSACLKHRKAAMLLTDAPGMTPDSSHRGSPYL